MDHLVLTGFRIGVLVLLWLFILCALRAMYKDTNAAAGVASRKARGAKTATRPPTARKTGPARRMTVVEGPLKGSYMDISTVGDVVMGRAKDCDFVLGDDYASTRHARLFRRGSDWFVEDLESRNGTIVSGIKIDQPEPVDTTTPIRMGRTTVRLMP